MLPAFISYQFSRRDEGDSSTSRSLVRGAVIGLTTSLGFVFVFLTVGLLVSLSGAQIGPYLPGVTIIIGTILIVIGALSLTNFKLSFHVSMRLPTGGGILSFFIFGIGYATASAACAFPVFLMVLLTAAASGGLASGLLIFLVYSLGMVVIMIPLAAAVSISRNLVLARIERLMPHMKKISAGILIAAGIYLILLHAVIS